MKRSLFKESLEIPHRKMDDYMVYLGYHDYNSKIRQNFMFYDSLCFTGFSRRRSSVKGTFVSNITANKYEMFLTDFEKLLIGNSETEIIQREITPINLQNLIGTFCFRKVGANYYGVVLLEGEK